jgi:nicotinate-nucleotide adenylyltransferase
MASLPKRLASARRVARHPRLVVTDIETDLATIYTADTLRALRRRFPRAQFAWLMGADNLRSFARWKDWQDVFQLVPVAVFRRPAYAVGRGHGKAAQRFDRAWRPLAESRILAGRDAPSWLVMDNVLNPMSATTLRKGKPRWPK